MSTLKLVSTPLCPYAQRAAIALAEKGEPFERVVLEAGEKPEWFRRASPLGKVPVLLVGEDAIFESAVILEYLEDTVTPRLHPADPLRRADHRAWIEVGSAVISEVAGLYRAPDAAGFEARRATLRERFERVEARLVAAPWFDGDAFSLVDAVFGPVFRYFDLFEEAGHLGILEGLPKLARWRAALAERPSVRGAVAPDYPERLRAFVAGLGSHLGGRLARQAAA